MFLRITLMAFVLLFVGCTDNSRDRVLTEIFQNSNAKYNVKNIIAEDRGFFGDASYFYQIEIYIADVLSDNGFLAKKGFVRSDGERLESFTQKVVSTFNIPSEQLGSSELYIAHMKLESLCNSSPCSLYWLSDAKKINPDVYLRIVSF